MVKIEMGFLSMLGVAFIVLKLTGVISWNWFLVLSPILVPIILTAVVLMIAGIFLIIHLIIQK